jgi:hypothetical protein
MQMSDLGHFVRDIGRICREAHRQRRRAGLIAADRAAYTLDLRNSLIQVCGLEEVARR